MIVPQIYDQIISHYLFGNFRFARNARRISSYRFPDGARCLIGCLIPDEVFVPEMLYTSITDGLLKFPGMEHLRVHGQYLGQFLFDVELGMWNYDNIGLMLEIIGNNYKLRISDSLINYNIF